MIGIRSENDGFFEKRINLKRRETYVCKNKSVGSIMRRSKVTIQSQLMTFSISNEKSLHVNIIKIRKEMNIPLTSGEQYGPCVVFNCIWFVMMIRHKLLMVTLFSIGLRQYDIRYFPASWNGDRTTSANEIISSF